MYYMDDCARISIGTPAEMRRVKEEIEEFFNKK
jgi:histidinol-phosphate/aromatic aminotransferase/cobyric acid decarboxylase-like protein